MTTLYHSEEEKSDPTAIAYNQTEASAYRYLAYRDLPQLLKKYCQGRQAIDYGSGTGISTAFLAKQGFLVTGVDVSVAMLHQAQERLPDIKFQLIENQKLPFCDGSVDLIFSSFVLFEICTKENLLLYSQEAFRALKSGGIFLIIAGSDYLYSRDWHAFDVAYQENQELKSGDRAKMRLPSENLEFIDFFWTDADIKNILCQSGLTILEKYAPLGKTGEPYHWKAELTASPYTIWIARKSRI